MISRIYFIRHGITEGNTRKWFYGKADLPLTEDGKETLRRLKERGIYPDIPADADCYTSELMRTDETFRIIYGDRPRKALPLLNEMQFGDYECKTYEELKGYDDFDSWAYDKTGDVKLPGGESRNEFAARISRGLRELINLHRMKEWSHRHGGQAAVSVVVCHGGVISAVMQELFPGVNGTMWDWIPDPGLGYMVEFKDGDPMAYEHISEIKRLGFGFMRLPMADGEVDIEQTKKMVDMFMERGYTYFDTAYGYLDGKSEEAVKTALVDRYPRDSYQLATKLPAFIAGSRREAEAMLETSLERTGAGYFDYYLLHNLGDDRTKFYDDYELWDFVARKKAEGKIVNAGFSFHDHGDELEQILSEHPEADFVQLQINYADWDDPVVEAGKCYDVARNNFKPVIIMEPVKGGNLASLPEPAARILAEKDPEQSQASWALRFAMGLPGVVTVLSGMSDVAQMAENLDIADSYRPLSDDEKETLSQAAEAMRAIPNIPCTACKYCIDGCPAGIPIHGVFRALNMKYVFNNETGAGFAYQWETRDGGIASRCLKCGHCEGVCPQHIKIIDELEKAVEMFE